MKRIQLGMSDKQLQARRRRTARYATPDKRKPGLRCPCGVHIVSKVLVSQANTVRREVCELCASAAPLGVLVRPLGWTP